VVERLVIPSNPEISGGNSVGLPGRTVQEGKNQLPRRRELSNLSMLAAATSVMT